jgi:hypothetical protein
VGVDLGGGSGVTPVLGVLSIDKAISLAEDAVEGSRAGGGDEDCVLRIVVINEIAGTQHYVDGR